MSNRGHCESAMLVHHPRRIPGTTVAAADQSIRPPTCERTSRLPDEGPAARSPDAWAIKSLEPPKRRGPFFLRGIARLKPGVTIEQAATELEMIARDVERANPTTTPAFAGRAQ